MCLTEAGRVVSRTRRSERAGSSTPRLRTGVPRGRLRDPSPRASEVYRLKKGGTKTTYRRSSHSDHQIRLWAVVQECDAGYSRRRFHACARRRADGLGCRRGVGMTYAKQHRTKPRSPLPRLVTPHHLLQTNQSLFLILL